MARHVPSRLTVVRLGTLPMRSCDGFDGGGEVSCGRGEAETKLDAKTIQQRNKTRRFMAITLLADKLWSARDERKRAAETR